MRCDIRNCEGLFDPLSNHDIMLGLSEERKEKILKFKNEADRKRSLMAGIMIRDNLAEYGISQGDIKVTDNGRLYVDEAYNIDFNISHSGNYVLMVIGDGRLGCDIELVRDRNTSVAKRCFTKGELDWITKQDDETLGFYRIWTARESYAKMTGEGILLDFKKYGVCVVDNGEVEVYRESKKQDCIIEQYLYDNDYVISICCEVL